MTKKIEAINLGTPIIRDNSCHETSPSAPVSNEPAPAGQLCPLPVRVHDYALLASAEDTIK
jgi:hypothetical protein